MRTIRKKAHIKWGWGVQPKFKDQPSLSTKLVLMYLVHHSDDSGDIVVPIQVLSEKTGFQQRTIRKSLRLLQSQQIIHRPPDDETTIKILPKVES